MGGTPASAEESAEAEEAGCKGQAGKWWFVERDADARPKTTTMTTTLPSIKSLHLRQILLAAR